MTTISKPVFDEAEAIQLHKIIKTLGYVLDALKTKQSNITKFDGRIDSSINYDHFNHEPLDTFLNSIEHAVKLNLEFTFYSDARK